ncbi:hypothetical protein [Mesorhizobium temperatum]|uniref:Uncharacterized protein n=1 Tax=Mesorhizobium temperatum TaxID=241416 RepID=A0A271LDL7_9HYPH|nr:hypothetical protein [Mesorhizobium temperatum]PAQ05410.1 hypothetical protein CIT26_30315 [Mesorhizobium temperatum]
MDFIKPIQDNWAVVTAAPWAFVAFTLIGILAGRFWQNGVVSTLTSRLALRDDRIAEYERKLDGASPDEAHHKIAELERRLDTMSDPRLFSEEQLGRMAASIDGYKGKILITRDGGSVESAKVHVQLRRFFKRMGWDVDSWETMGSDNPPACGLVVFSGKDPPKDEIVVLAAFDAAGIGYEKLSRTRSPASLPISFYGYGRLISPALSRSTVKTGCSGL